MDSEYLYPSYQFNPSQQRILATIPHVTGPLSMFGSALVIRDVLLYKQRKVMYHKLLLGMSCCDLISSLAFSFSTAPMPKLTLNVYEPSGTEQTCTLQAFFIQTSLGTAAFNASLAIYYLLTTRYKWTEEHMAKIGKFMLVTPLFLGYGTALVGVVMKLFHSASLWCWIAPRPKGCEVVSREECVMDEVPCPFRWALFYGPLWLFILVAMVSMILVYKTVLQQEKEVDAYQSNGEQIRDRSKRVAWQAFFFILAFYLSWLPTTAYSISEISGASARVRFILAIGSTLFTPMQGFLNFLVYFRGLYNTHKRQNPNDSVLQAVIQSAFRGVSRPKRVSCPADHATADEDSGDLPRLDSEELP